MAKMQSKYTKKMRFRIADKHVGKKVFKSEYVEWLQAEITRLKQEKDEIWRDYNSLRTSF